MYIACIRHFKEPCLWYREVSNKRSFIEIETHHTRSNFWT